MGAAEVEALPTHHAVERDFAAATQYRALNAIVLLRSQVLEIDTASFHAYTNSLRVTRARIPFAMQASGEFARIKCRRSSVRSQSPDERKRQHSGSTAGRAADWPHRLAASRLPHADGSIEAARGGRRCKHTLR
jgi:hypothetical protein